MIPLPGLWAGVTKDCTLRFMVCFFTAFVIELTTDKLIEGLIKIKTNCYIECLYFYWGKRGI